MFFPVFVDLSEKEILVAGAGTIAQRRIRTLCGFGGRITVTAPAVSKEIERLSAAYGIRILRREFQPSDLQGKDLVLAATDSREVNREISRLCRQQGIPVNVCSDQSLCDFQFPSVVEDGSIVIGLNASGRDHRLVKQVRKRTEALLAQEGFGSRYLEK